MDNVELLEDEGIEDNVRVGKKRKANKSLWIWNKMKVAKLKGQAHTDYKGRVVEAKTTGPPCSCKRKNCLDAISEEDQEDILTNFYDLQTKKKADLFAYHEGFARKGPNDVCSFLLQSLNNVSEQYTELHLYSDNCWGQNKNHALARLLTALTEMKKFEKIEQYYPMRGHSLLSCDRDFSIIKREMRNHDRIYTVGQIVELILKSSKTNTFKVVEVKTEDILNFKDWWTMYYKKTCVSEETKGKKATKVNKVYYTISTMMHTTYNSEFLGQVVARPTINSILSHNFKFPNPGRPPLQLPTNKAYPEGKAAIKEAKIADIRKLQQYIPAEHQEFYNEIFLWPTTTEDTEDQ